MGYANCCEALAKADIREQLKDIKISVLVIAGTQDPVTTVADGEFMQQRIPQSKLVEIDASHISNVEQPEAFNKILKDFLVN
jgi:3-oxoadipate enol-lactonase